MRREDKETIDQRKIEEILKNGILCHIAMADENNPYLVTVNYGYRDNTIYFHSSHEGKKIAWIIKNPHVCFMIYMNDELVTGENPCSDWTMKYKSVIGYGHAYLLDDPAEKEKGLNILMAQYTDQKPCIFDKNNLNKTAVIKIDIEKISAKISGY